MHYVTYLQLRYSFISIPTLGNKPQNTSRTNSHCLSQREQDTILTDVRRGFPQEMGLKDSPPVLRERSQEDNAVWERLV